MRASLLAAPSVVATLLRSFLVGVAYIRGGVSGGGGTNGDIEDEKLLLLFGLAHFGIFAMLY